MIKYKKIWNFLDIIFERGDIILDFLDINVWILGDIIFQTSEYHPWDSLKIMIARYNLVKTV